MADSSAPPHVDLSTAGRSKTHLQWMVLDPVTDESWPVPDVRRSDDCPDW